ncbi:MAG: hypothetical protein LBN10_06810 [Propionibacteriaceae bacterium]|nr:hypothetical protein [Propionibacteriaceae bacterium]
MKKAMAMTASILTLTLALTSCGGDSGGGNQGNASTSTQATSQETTAAPDDSPSTAAQEPTKTFSMNSITLEAPESWTEGLNNADGTAEVMRLTGENADGAEIIMEVGYYVGGGTIESVKQSLAYFNTDLQEVANVVLGADTWGHLTATTRRDGSAVLYNGYYTQLDGKLLLIDFRGLTEDDPRIPAILTSVKTK